MEIFNESKIYKEQFNYVSSRIKSGHEVAMFELSNRMDKLPRRIRSRIIVKIKRLAISLGSYEDGWIKNIQVVREDYHSYINYLKKNIDGTIHRE